MCAERIEAAPTSYSIAAGRTGIRTWDVYSSVPHFIRLRKHATAVSQDGNPCTECGPLLVAAPRVRQAMYGQVVDEIIADVTLERGARIVDGEDVSIGSSPETLPGSIDGGRTLGIEVSVDGAAAQELVYHAGQVRNLVSTTTIASNAP